MLEKQKKEITVMLGCVKLNNIQVLIIQEKINASKESEYLINKNFFIIFYSTEFVKNIDFIFKF